ncbi:MFS transporter [Streptomyces odontomachi]|uniref:MFS transporter n=1 Tax=Streptomyces odontomachi TaxID=2944940 RepID=UPI00210E4F16|nr:MFS transporter [Streptomyces sp. ODS25]
MTVRDNRPPHPSTDVTPPQRPSGISDETTRTGLAASLLSGLGWLFDAYVINIFALVLPLVALSFGTSPARLGIVASLFLLGYAVGTIGFGLLTDRLGRKRSLSLSIGGYAVLTALTGASPNIATMGVLRFLTGVGGGGELPVGATFTSEMWPARRRGLGIGLMYSGYPLGYLLAVGGAFVADIIGWRWIFVMSLVPGVLILAIRSAIKESPRFVVVQEQMQQRSAQARGSRHDFLNVRTILADKVERRHLLIGVLIFIPLAYCYYALSVFLPEYMRETLHLSYNDTLVYLTFLTVSYFVLAILVAWLGDIVGRKPTAIGSAVVAGIGGVAMFTTHSPATFLAIGLIAYPAWVGLTWTIGIAYVNEIFPTSMRGSGFGLSVGAGRIISIAAPTIGGALSGSIGLGGSFKVAAGLWVLLVIGFLLGPETKRKTLEEIERSEAERVHGR